MDRPKRPSVVGIDLSNHSIRAVQLSQGDSLTSLDSYGYSTHKNHLDLFELLNTDTVKLLGSPVYGTFAPSELIISLPHSYYSRTLVASSSRDSSKIIRESLNALPIHDIENTSIYSLPIKKLHSVYDGEDMFIYSVIVLHSAYIDELDAFTRSLGLKKFSLSTPLASLAKHIRDQSRGSSFIISSSEDSIHLIFSSPSTLTTATIDAPTGSATAHKKAWDFIESQEVAFLSPSDRQGKLYVAGEDTRGIVDSIVAKAPRQVELINPWRHTALYPLKPMPKKYRHVYSSAIGMGLQEEYYRPL